MKRIAVIGIRGLPANYGGLETCANEVCRRWAAEGHDVLIYCRSSRYAERIPEYHGIKLRYVPSVTTPSLDTISHTFLCILDLIVNRREYKSIHLYNTGNAILVPLLKLFGRFVVLSGDGIEWKREKWGRLAKFVHKTGEVMASRFVDHIVVDNDEVGAYYRERHGVDTVQIAYGANRLEADPALTDKLMAEHGLEPGRYFIFVGRFVPEKGVDRLIAAYQRLDTDMPLVLIGDDNPNSEYRNRVFSKASEDIRLLGFVYAEAYEQLLVNAYMYVSASSLEGTSPSLLAAMGAGVCSLVNGIPENRATVKGTIETYAENDEDDLVRLWQGYIDSPEKAHECAVAGLKCVEDYYSWDSVARDYLELFPEAEGTVTEDASDTSRESAEQ